MRSRFTMYPLTVRIDPLARAGADEEAGGDEAVVAADGFFEESLVAPDALAAVESFLVEVLTTLRESLARGQAK